MNNNNDSLVEICVGLMHKKRKPQTLRALAVETFEKKGIDINDYSALAQFEVDFMISGHFIYCGVDARGNQLWDLKERQKSDLLDRDVDVEKDLYADDEDVIKNELKDDYEFDDKVAEFANDDDELVEEKDEIEEELGLSGAYHIEGDEESLIEVEDNSDSQDEEDDEDEIEEVITCDLNDSTSIS